MQELGVDYTIRIKYITEQKSHRIICEDKTVFEQKQFNYKRLFNFINFDMTVFSEDLISLYECDPNNLFVFKVHFDKINKHVKKIFGFSDLVITRYFIQTDYIEHIKHAINDMQTVEDEKLKEQCLNFFTGLYRVHNNSEKITVEPPLDYLSRNYIEDLYNSKIEPFTRIKGPLDTTSNPKPPHILYALQKSCINYLHLDVSSNEARRLQADNHLAQAEYQQLVYTARKKSENNRNFSEKVAWNIFLSKESQKNMKKKELISKHSDNQANKAYPRRYEYTFPHVVNIQLALEYMPNFSHVFAYYIDTLEAILILDMYYLVKSKHFVFCCPHCGKFFDNVHANARFCCTSCKNKHQETIKSSCAPWKTYERIRKKLYAQRKSKYSITTKESLEYGSKLNDSIHSFFNLKIDANEANNTLLLIEKDIDKRVKTIKYNSKIGDSNDPDNLSYSLPNTEPDI